EPQERQKLADPAANGLARQQIHAAYEGQILAARQIIEECQVFRNDADLPLDFERLMGIEHVLTEDADVAASRGQEAGQHFDRRGLARAVRAKKPIERAALDSEFD